MKALNILSILVILMVVDETLSGARVLILHPIYAGSHELTLRRFGEELVKRGHEVTQVRWRSSKTRQVTSSVQVMTLSPNNSDLR